MFKNGVAVKLRTSPLQKQDPSTRPLMHEPGLLTLLNNIQHAAPPTGRCCMQGKIITLHNKSFAKRGNGQIFVRSIHK